MICREKCRDCYWYVRNADFIGERQGFVGEREVVGFVKEQVEGCSFGGVRVALAELEENGIECPESEKEGGSL